MEKHQVSQPWIMRDIIDHYRHNNQNYLMTQMLVFLTIPANNIRPIELSSLSSNSSTLSKQGGRPKGTTIESTHDLQARTIEANNFAAEFERAQLQRRWDGKKWVSEGVYDEIIDEASARIILPDTIVLSKETAWTWTKDKSLKSMLVAHPPCYRSKLIFLISFWSLQQWINRSHQLKDLHLPIH